MSFLKLGLVSSYDFSSDSIDCVSSCLSLWAPDIHSFETVDMGYNTIQRHPATGWHLESLISLTQCPLIIRGNLVNTLNTRISPAQVLTDTIGTHTRIQFFFVPGVLRFYLVFPPKEVDFSPALNHTYSQNPAFHAALELAMTYDGHTLHQININSPHPVSPSYAKIRISSFSTVEAIHKLMTDPKGFKVIYTSQECAEFIYALLKNIYADQLGVSTIEVGSASMVFAVQETKLSLLLSLGLLLRYLSYRQTAIALEEYISNYWQNIQHNPISWIKDHLVKNVLKGEQDEKHPWRQLSRKYYDLSLQKKTILGFDILVNPVSAVHTMGAGIEELAASYSFYLDSIAHHNIQLYPLSPLTPSFDTTWCCRFLARSSPLQMQEIGTFLERLSSVYPWTCIALLYEYEGKRNFIPFISLA